MIISLVEYLAFYLMMYRLSSVPSSLEVLHALVVTIRILEVQLRTWAMLAMEGLLVGIDLVKERGDFAPRYSTWPEN